MMPNMQRDGWKKEQNNDVQKKRGKETDLPETSFSFLRFLSFVLVKKIKTGNYFRQSWLLHCCAESNNEQDLWKRGENRKWPERSFAGYGGKGGVGPSTKKQRKSKEKKWNYFLKNGEKGERHTQSSWNTIGRERCESRLAIRDIAR